MASSPTASAAELPLYVGIQLDDVVLVRTREQAAAALTALLANDAVGFDTESKPTFAKGEVSTGPHLIQLSTADKAYLFPVDERLDREVVRQVLESPKVLKVGFGLRDDLLRLQSKLGIHSAHVLDLASALRQDKRGDVGAKSAVAMFFGQRLQKSKRTSTTNWANPRLSEQQILYAANDAQVALRVYRAWKERTLRSVAVSPAPTFSVGQLELRASQVSPRPASLRPWDALRTAFRRLFPRS